VERFLKELTAAIAGLLAPDQAACSPDSPVYTFLPQLTPPVLSAPPRARAAALPDRGVPSPTRVSGNVGVAAPAGTVGLAGHAAGGLGPTHSVLMQQVDEAEKAQNFATAKALLTVVRSLMKAEADAQQRPENPYILQRLALATYKSGLPTPDAALAEARALLATLAPATSNDTETLGLWGGVHKRLWLAKHELQDLDEAVRAHERGFYLRNDYYNGINLAFLLNVRAAEAADPADAIADFVLARRVRREVLSICDQWLAANATPSDGASAEAVAQFQETRYWVLATRGEALFGLESPDAAQHLEAAYAVAPRPWMVKTTRDQIQELAGLLAASPLRRITSGTWPQIT
jgi:hypothetical protein